MHFFQSLSVGDECTSCQWNGTGRLPPEKFDLLPLFLESAPTTDCPKGGLAAYSHVSTLPLPL